MVQLNLSSKNISLILLIFLNLGVFQSQNRLQKIDSLKKNLNSVSKKEKVFLLEKIVKNYSYENLDSSLFYNKKMLLASKNIKDDSLIIYSYNLKGDILHEKAKYSESITAFNTALNLNSNFDKLKAYSYNGLGNNYTKLENFEKATNIYLKTLERFIKVKDTFMIIGTQLHLANNFRKLKDFSAAEMYYTKAIDFNNSKNEMLEHFLYNNLSDLYNDMDKPSLSLKNSKKALTYFEKKNFEKFSAYSIYNMAVSYDKLNKNYLAEKNYLKAIDIHTKFNNQYELANSYSSLGNYYVKTSNYRNAIKASEKAIKFSETIKSIEFQILSYKILAEANQKYQKYQKSFLYFKKYDSLNNKYYEENKLKITKNLSEQYQTEKKEKELLQTKAEKATTELKLTNQKQVTYTLIGGLVILLLLAFSIFQRNKRKHQLAIANEKEKNLQSIILAEEKERTRIAKELHDGIVQQIGSVIINSRNIFSKLETSNKSDYKKLLGQLENTSEELRSISHQMMPRALEESGLITALKELFYNSLQQAGIKHSFESENITERFTRDIEVTLYRITQELINNILKHSNATEVFIQLNKTKTHLIYLVEDNGKGFKNINTSGIGINNIKSRIQMIKGSVNIDSTDNKGTLAIFKIPL